MTNVSSGLGVEPGVSARDIERCGTLIRMRGGLGSSVVLLALGCAAPPPVPPTAVLDASPEEVCRGDAFSTPIVLSAARSAARLSLVPAPPDPDDAPLSFRWQLEGDEHFVVAGDLDARELTVLMAGDRPLHATLNVTTFEGGVAETLASIGVVLPIAPPCGEGCPSGSACVEHQGAEVCLPDAVCASDAECSGCFVCDLARSRCVPPERR